MASLEERLKYAEFIRRAYDDALTAMLETTASQLTLGFESDSWEAQKIRELQDYRKAIAGEWKGAREAAERIPAEFEDAYFEGSRDAVEWMEKANIADIDASLADAPKAGIRALGREAVRGMEAGRLQVLRQFDDGYRQIISRVAAETLTGAITRRDATQQALNQFAESGIGGFIDRSGRRWDLASYGEMATRTGVMQAQRQGAADQYQANGRDLVIVSDSPEECELCRPWEGRVLSVSGLTPGYPTVADATADGLFHANCTHVYTLYVPGLTEKVLRGAEENPDGYQERQQQRYIERGIRDWKRRKAIAITPEAKAQAGAYVKKWDERMTAFIEENDRIRTRYREQITKAR